jgi:hypothetical protein
VVDLAIFSIFHRRKLSLSNLLKSAWLLMVDTGFEPQLSASGVLIATTLDAWWVEVYKLPHPRII